MSLGFVLEGGAMRGLFSAGVVDVLMEHNILPDAIVGVSAGAAFGCNIKSGQIGRAIRYNMRFADDKRYCSTQSLINTGNLFNAMFCYHTVPNELDVFDRESFNASPMKFYVVCTDVETGQAEYHLCERANDWMFEWIRASASLPLVSKPVKLEDRKYLDGGMTDSIPLRFMQEQGYDKNLVILTQPREYVKEKSSMLPLMKWNLRKYPKAFEAIKNRHLVYNENREYIFEQEKAGDAFVICPKEPLAIGRIEHDPQVMKQVYELGRQIAEEQLEALQNYLCPVMPDTP